MKASAESLGDDVFGQMKANEVVEYIKERVASKEAKLRTRIIPYDLSLAVRPDLGTLLLLTVV